MEKNESGTQRLMETAKECRQAADNAVITASIQGMELAGKLSRKLAGLGGFVTAASVLLTSAYAASDDELTNGITTGVKNIYSILTGIVFPIAVIALAICAVQILWGGERQAEKAKGTAIRIVVAIAVVYGAPLIILEVTDWFKDMSASVSW